MGYSSCELDEIMKAMDCDKDGFIDIKKWKAATVLSSGINQSHSEQKLREAFNFFDKESRGKISNEEFRKVLSKLYD
jgi:Ca2+-binding EF-hand superfamily protein